MRKQEYVTLARSICRLMKDHGATQDKYGAYYIDTPCGQLRVSLKPFEPRMKTVWVFTRIEHPDMVSYDLRSRDGFNAFSGKYNNFSRDANWLFRWLSSYVAALVAT